MADEALVVQGGRLIDGTGRPPIENAAVVIRGGRFQAVGRSGEVAISFTFRDCETRARKCRRKRLGDRRVDIKDA